MIWFGLTFFFYYNFLTSHLIYLKLWKGHNLIIYKWRRRKFNNENVNYSISIFSQDKFSKLRLWRKRWGHVDDIYWWIKWLYHVFELITNLFRQRRALSTTFFSSQWGRREKKIPTFTHSILYLNWIRFNFPSHQIQDHRIFLILLFFSFLFFVWKIKSSV